ncbi:iron-containing alcohol dehydrogenase [Acidimangrovimonas sediminis]|uniref:iron-containing alcohol dehydrogenase n=1 Tax=Acidimangrovimonas sediminis TaxID=2056283 RepID=UPI000C802FEA|nr:iron-containing alcohol dehydrogenase [Acidimangrovimonas sediminis]
MNFDLGVMRAPARILFGVGQRHALAAAARTLGSRTLGARVLICTDARFAELPEMADILARMKAAGLDARVFSDTEAELPLGNIGACVAQHAAFDPQVIVGLGGGSCLDLAKLVSLSLSHEGPLSRYYGEFKVPGPIRPVIAVPTTSGTGSEVTPVAVVADPDRAMKVGISSPELIPHTAICDPELTLSCPLGLTAASGADALAHAIEAFCAIRRKPDPEIAMTRVFVGKNVLSDHHALAAIRLIFDWLPRAVADGSDLEARSAIMLASTLAGLAFATAGTAAAHAIQYPIGALTHTAHGLGVGVLLPYTMEYNAEAAPEAYAEVAKAIGAGNTASDAISAVRELFRTIGMPPDLGAIGMPEDRIDWAAENAMNAARLVENNPRELSAAAVARLIRAALVPS